MENIKKEIREVVEDYKINGLEILVMISDDKTLKENVEQLIKDYRDWHETIEERIGIGLIGSCDYEEYEVREDFLEDCCDFYDNIVKKMIGDEDNRTLSYKNIMDIMYRIMSTLESYYYNYN